MGKQTFYFVVVINNGIQKEKVNIIPKAFLACSEQLKEICVRLQNSILIKRIAAISEIMPVDTFHC